MLGLISHTLLGRSGVFLSSRLRWQCRPGRISLRSLPPPPSPVPAFICAVLNAALQWRSHVRASACLSCRPEPLSPQPRQSQAPGRLELVALSACPALYPVLLACICWSLPLCGLLQALLPLGSCTCLSCARFLWSIGLGMAPVYS